MKVEIWVWKVEGQASTIYCLSEEEANNANIGFSGWGTITKIKRTAELVE